MRDILVALCFVVAATAHAAGNDTVIWRSEWKDAFAAAKEQHRLVLVDYYADWCKPCQQMEATVFRDPEVLRRLSDFVLLRLDVDRSAIPRAHRVSAFPTYVVFDPSERERYRIVGFKPFNAFYETIAQVGSFAPAFLRASELFDAKQDFDGSMLVGNAYGHLGMTDEARTAYQQGRKAAQQRDDKGGAQLAEALSAFTFVRDGDPIRAITLLQNLAAKPATRDSETLIWLSIGNAYRAALDPKAALEAFQRAQSLAAPDSPSHKEASAATAAAIAAQNDPVEAELRALQGKWVPFRLEADGKTLEGRKGVGATVSIKFSKWIEKSAGGEAPSSFSIDPAKDPKQIDVVHQLDNGMRVSLPGIYTLEGDTLKISQAFPFGGNVDALQKRPGVFTTQPGDNFVVTTYKRATK